MTSVSLYCTGRLLLTFVGHPAILPVAVVVFICGEVAMTPCFDETAKRHGKAAGMGSCMGILHFVDGLGRLAGAAFALAVYSAMRNTSHRDLYWPIVAGSFFCTSSALHVLASVFADKPSVNDKVNLDSNGSTGSKPAGPPKDGD